MIQWKVFLHRWQLNMHCYFIKNYRIDNPDFEFVEENSIDVKFAGTGEALSYLTRLDDWAESREDTDSEIVWDIDLATQYLKIYFSNTRDITLYLLSTNNSEITSLWN